MEDVLKERYELVSERIRELPGESLPEKAFNEYFESLAAYIIKADDLNRLLETRELEEFTLEELKSWNKALYEDIAGEAYDTSVTNPKYLSQIMPTDLAPYFAAAAAEIHQLTGYVFERRCEEITVVMELFAQLYFQCSEGIPRTETIKDILYWYVWDYLPLIKEAYVKSRLVPDAAPGGEIVRKALASCRAGKPDERYLYMYGEYVSDNDVKMSRHVNSLPEDVIERIAFVYTDGFKRGFAATGKDLGKKGTANIYCPIGFERIIGRSMEMLEDMGIKAVLYRNPSGIMSPDGGRNHGYYGSSPNRQFDYDHNKDIALVLDNELNTRRIEVIEKAYSGLKEAAGLMAGPAVVEFWGGKPFAPDTETGAPAYDERQKKLKVKYAGKSAEIVHTYIPPEDRSFTIISFPTPEIGDNFEEIFNEVVRINTLDNDTYARIQQHIIDALDEGSAVKISGMNGNRTDLTVALHELNDPDTETNFENCTADVNIPVGEVFTSPLLKGTNGILHVKGVYLNGLYYEDFEMEFKDGMTGSYSCKGHEGDGSGYIADNLMNGHASLPMGEFAIGTNTAAYVMSRNYGIEDRLDILIAEKTGPHFAIGDTCYSYEEDIITCNPDGKKIVARENECSALRNTDPARAYFHCHTDITIPYDELGSLVVLKPDAGTTEIIRNGRFVLPGTEELNDAFNAALFDK